MDLSRESTKLLLQVRVLLGAPNFSAKRYGCVPVLDTGGAGSIPAVETLYLI